MKWLAFSEHQCMKRVINFSIWGIESGLYTDSCKHTYMCAVWIHVYIDGGGVLGGGVGGLGGGVGVLGGGVGGCCRGVLGGGAGGCWWLQCDGIGVAPSCTSLSMCTYSAVPCWRGPFFSQILTIDTLQLTHEGEMWVSVVILKFDLNSVAVITVPIVVYCKLDCVMAALDCMYMHVVYWICI